MIKKCPKCKSILTHSEFVPNKSAKSGLSSWCLSCIKQYNASEPNKIKARLRSKEFRRRKGLKPLSLRASEMVLIRSGESDLLTCGYCEDKKPLSNFKKRNDRNESFNSYCANCVNIKARERRSKLKKPSKFDKWSIQEKRIARIKSSNAIASGKLIKLPCIICGSSDVQAHHEDYDKPLDVIWLCSKHHGEAHRRYDKSL